MANAMATAKPDPRQDLKKSLSLGNLHHLLIADADVYRVREAETEAAAKESRKPFSFVVLESWSSSTMVDW